MTPTRSSAARTLTFAAPLNPRTMPSGAVVLGATVDVFAKEPEADGTRWVELAYAVSMVDSDVTLSKEDFEQCVVNHRRYPCVPVVIEHADTSWFGDREWREPHGYVEELRVGEREVTEADGTKRMAATLDGRVSFDEATSPTVGPKKKWRFGSITLIKGAVDEATGAGLGAMLWSWSLTAHPRLTGLMPIAASLNPASLTPELAAELRAALDAAPTPRGTAATHAPETPPMKTFLAIAAQFGLAAATEEEARDKVLAFLALGADAVKALGLAPTATAQELAAKLTPLSTAAARVPALEKELTTLRSAKAERDKLDRDQHFEELFCVQPELRAAEGSLRYQAEHDPEGFAKAHPRPTAQELMQAAQNPERAARVVPPSGQPPQGNGGAQGAGAQGAAVDAANVLTSVVRNHMAMARSQGRDLSFTAALAEVSQFGGNGLQG